MRDIHYEHLRPDEIILAQETKSIIYLPIGPLEWHGPAMPMGTDPVLAGVVAQKVAEKTGGLVLPVLYVGTERERDRETMDSMGFEKEISYIIGQDFPRNTLPSFYFREEIFSLVIREYLRILSMQKFRLIVIINGHGARNQSEVLQRLAAEFSAETESSVMIAGTFASIFENDRFEGHGTKAETSMTMYAMKKDVDLNELPKKPEPLKNCDWGIDGGMVYMHKPNKDKTIEPECDPRDATSELGEHYIQATVAQISREVEHMWSIIGE